MYVNMGCSSLGEPRGTETWSEDQVNQYVNALTESVAAGNAQQARSIWETLAQSAPQWITQLISVRTGYQCQQLNLQRAAAGMPLINCEDMGVPVRVSAGLDKNTMLLIGGAVVALLVILAIRRR